MRQLKSAVPAFVLFVLLCGLPALAQTAEQNLPATDLGRIKAGVEAPDFTLEDQDGKPVKLSQYRGKKSVVLVFYRGYW
jgi:cytochrome oxidase Cu insertion factor (SCO1/SenC/PrrC family)